MKKEHFRTIAKFSDLPSAKLAQAKLDASGIMSWLDNEHIAALNWFYINLTGGISLRVEESDEKDALLILKDTENVNDENEIKEVKNTKSRAVWITIIIFFILPLIIALLANFLELNK